MIENASLIYWLKINMLEVLFLLPRVTKKSKLINDIIVDYLEYCTYKIQNRKDNLLGCNKLS